MTGKTKSIGISNCNYHQLKQLLEVATVKPLYVQKRCFAHTGWERKIRNLCKEHGILFQPYSILTANRRELENPKIKVGVFMCFNKEVKNKYKGVNIIITYESKH